MPSNEISAADLTENDWRKFDFVGWEDGVLGSLEAGVKSSTFHHPGLVEKWEELIELFVPLEKKIAEFEDLMERLEGERDEED